MSENNEQKRDRSNGILTVFMLSMAIGVGVMSADGEKKAREASDAAQERDSSLTQQHGRAASGWSVPSLECLEAMTKNQELTLDDALATVPKCQMMRAAVVHNVDPADVPTIEELRAPGR